MPTATNRRETAIEALERARAAEVDANRAVDTKAREVREAERAEYGTDELARLRAQRDLPRLRAELAEVRILAAAARQTRTDAEPAYREERAAHYRPLVLAKVRELDAALAEASTVNAELQRLIIQARSDGGHNATDSGLPWAEFGDPERPQAGSRYETWRDHLRRYGWL